MHGNAVPLAHSKVNYHESAQLKVVHLRARQWYYYAVATNKLLTIKMNTAPVD